MTRGQAMRRGGTVVSLRLYLLTAALLAMALTAPIVIVQTTRDSLVSIIERVLPDARISVDDVLLILSSYGVSLDALISSAEYSILSGALQLRRGGNALPALVIIGISILFPVVKVVAGMASVLIDSRVLRSIFLVHLYRFSMLDVFVVAIGVFVSSGLIGYTASFGPGLYFFLGYFVVHYCTEAYRQHALRAA